MPTIFVRFIDNHRVASEPSNEALWRTGDVIDILPFGHVLTPAEEAGKAIGRTPATATGGNWKVIRIAGVTPQEMSNMIAATTEGKRRDNRIKLLGAGGLVQGMTVPKRQDFDAGEVQISKALWDSYVEVRT